MQSPEIRAQIEDSLALADDIGLVGTPSFIAGNRAVFGYLSKKDLAGLVAGGPRRKVTPHRAIMRRKWKPNGRGAVIRPVCVPREVTGGSARMSLNPDAWRR